jgi:hypothetical protein
MMKEFVQDVDWDGIEQDVWYEWDSDDSEGIKDSE